MAYQEIDNSLLAPGAILDSTVLTQMNENAKALRTDSTENKSGRILKTVRHVDTTSRSFGTGAGAGYVSPAFVRVKSGSESKIRMRYRIPARNDNSSWGGCYNRIDYSLDGTNWTNAGDAGYGGGVMTSGGDSIDADQGEIWLENIPGNIIYFRFVHRSYEGTVYINSQNNITYGSNGWGYTNMYIEEISV